MNAVSATAARSTRWQPAFCPFFIGRATRAAEFLESAEKEYIAGLRLGTVTDTQDTSGTVLETHPVTVTREDVQAALAQFLGPIEQIPPMYSAIKIGGQKLYELTRRAKRSSGSPAASPSTSWSCWKGRDGVYHPRPLLQGGRMSAHSATIWAARWLRRLYVVPAPDTGRKLYAFAGRHDAAGAGFCGRTRSAGASHARRRGFFRCIRRSSSHWDRLQSSKNGAQVRDWQFRSGTYRVYAEDGEFLLLGRVENGLLTTIKSFFEVNTLAT